MLTTPWRRWLRRRSGPLSRRDRRSHSDHGLPRLEWLESRELLSATTTLPTTTTDYVINREFGKVLPAGAPGVGGFTPDQIRQA